MENKFLKKYFLLSFVLFSSSFFSQTKKINFLIMIDEQPCLSTYDMRLISPSMGSVDVNYIVGTIDLSDDNYDKLSNDQSSNFDVSFETLLSKSLFSQKYLISVPKIFLKQAYIIINIFNKDNKVYKKRYSGVNKNDKKEYYVVIKTPSAMKFD